MYALPPVPTAIAFRNAEDGLLGTERTIEVTTDGGRTWKVVVRTPRRVAWVGYDPGGRARAILDDGENLGGHQWKPVLALDRPYSPCRGRASFSGAWVLCIGQESAGAGQKAVYRLTRDGWKRVASPPQQGYAEGIAMAADGFGVIWESRGTLYVTRDGGSHWAARPGVAVPEIDFGISGAALRHGVAFVLLARGNVHRRLLETTDHGRTWRVVHRWR
jgi:photosystem II stability/assembly factor-like uncharacterized protein